MVKLTPKLISTEFQDEDLPSMQKLVLPGKGFEKIVRLSTCSQLIRLDLNNNSLTSLEGVSQNTTLKWLSAQSNQITNLAGLDTLKQLQVLNLGSNKLSGRLTITGLPALRALMLNDNQLTGVDGLAASPELNTLILKQNQVTDLGHSLHGCKALAKLSVAHNKMSQLGSALSNCSSLAELRVSHNALRGLPIDLSRNLRLKIIEAGANQIADFQQVQVLSQLPSLHQLNLRGCPIADKGDYQAQLLQQLPMLDVLDSRKVLKTGMPRTAKPAVATVQPKQNPSSKLTHEPEATTNTLPGSNQLKSKKRQPHPEESHDPNPKDKKARKDKLAAAVDTTTVENKKTPSVMAARAEGSKEHDVQRSDAKRKSKADKQAPKQAVADDSSRSFLADVLNPTEAEFATDPEVKPGGPQQSKPVAVSTNAASSGLVKVADAKTKGKKAKKLKVKQSGGESRQETSGVSGSRAAQLLQSSLGLDVLQVGLGGNAAWE